MPFFSTTLTVTTTAQPITTNKPHLNKVTQFQVVVRSMGTATYVAFGGLDSQDRRLTSAGGSISFSRENQNKYLEPMGVFAISDTSDAVIEIFGESD